MGAALVALRVPGGIQGQHQNCVNGKLGTPPQRQPVGDDLDAAVILVLDVSRSVETLSAKGLSGSPALPWGAGSSIVPVAQGFVDGSVVCAQTGMRCGQASGFHRRRVRGQPLMMCSKSKARCFRDVHTTVLRRIQVDGRSDGDGPVQKTLEQAKGWCPWEQMLADLERWADRGRRMPFGQAAARVAWGASPSRNASWGRSSAWHRRQTKRHPCLSLQSMSVKTP